MKQLRLLGLALLAVFAVGAVAAATASADASGILFLPAEEGPIAFSIKGGGGTLAAGKEQTIICTEVSGEAESLKEEESKKTHYKLGTGTLDFKGCKETKGSTKVACNTKGDAKETLLVPFNFHVFDVLNKAETELEPGISVLLEPLLTVLCAAETTKVEVKGAALGLLVCLKEQKCLSSEKDVTDVTAHFTSAGEICDKASGSTYCKEVLEKEPLLANFSGTFEKATEETEATMTLKEGTGKAKMFFLDD